MDILVNSFESTEFTKQQLHCITVGEKISLVMKYYHFIEMQI